MNFSEFKAWFEGFTESMDGTPSPKAWARIQARVKEIRDAPAASYPVYIDRYWNHPRHYWSYLSAVGSNQYQSNAPIQDLQDQIWNAADAFKILGRADAEDLN